MSLLIGAFDPSSWAGLVFSPGPGQGFALRLAVETDGGRASHQDLYFLIHEVGPHAPDGSYARVAFDLDLPFGKGPETPVLPRAGRRPGLVFEWGRVGAAGAVIRLSAGLRGVLEVEGYCPWDWRGRWSAAANGLEAEGPAGGFALRAGSAVPDSHLTMESGARLRFSVQPGAVLRFGAALCPSVEEAIASAEALTSQAGIDGLLAGAAQAYQEARVSVEEEDRDLAESITNNLHWMVALQPEAGRLYAPAGRCWIFPRREGGRDHWTIFEWDGFFGALELALESPELARSALAAVLDTQYPNGNIPNWRSRQAGTPDRSQPPLGAYVVLKLFGRTGERRLLSESLPALERWSQWWRAKKNGRPRRDGNQSGLFEWGSDRSLLGTWVPDWEKGTDGRQRAAWESGQDDLPCWDQARFLEDTETLNLESVDLNSLLALDDECLGLIASELGEESKAAFYRERCEGLRHSIRERLWDEERGLFVDRFWDGRFSDHLAASGFYPLLAGIPTAAQADRMLAKLLDERLFWGRFVLPSISRSDPAFGDQQYWRGSIWPPINYLVCQGLRRYGFDGAAAELSARSLDLFLSSFRDFQLCRENFDSRTGAGGGQRHQSWGPLFALLGVEEFVDWTPWEGLRVGSLGPASDRKLRRLRLAGRSWEVASSAAGLRVRTDGEELLDTDGPVVLRRLRFGAGSLSADIHSASPVRVRARGGQVLWPGGRGSIRIP